MGRGRDRDTGGASRSSLDAQEEDREAQSRAVHGRRGPTHWQRPCPVVSGQGVGEAVERVVRGRLEDPLGAGDEDCEDPVDPVVDTLFLPVVSAPDRRNVGQTGGQAGTGVEPEEKTVDNVLDDDGSVFCQYGDEDPEEVDVPTRSRVDSPGLPPRSRSSETDPYLQSTRSGPRHRV